MEIINYPNYLVSDHGDVWSKKRKIFLKARLVGIGYRSVQLGRGKNHKIHRLVAEHYIDNPENKYAVDHIDRNKENNHVSNLRWVTKSENEQNTGMRKNNKIGHKNIVYHTMSNGYQYEKMYNKVRHRKLFRTLTEALCYKYIITLKIKCGYI